MKLSVKAIALAVAVLCLVPAQRGALAQNESSISGRIVDAVAHKPVAGAKVELFDDSQPASAQKPLAVASSRRDGSFRLAGVPAGQYRVEVTKIGFQVQELTGLSVEADQHVIVGVPIALVAASADYAEKMACNTLVRPDEVADVYVVCSGK